MSPVMGPVMTGTEAVLAGLTRRLVTIGGSGAAVGGALALFWRTPAQRSFGQQTAAWGLIDLAIAAAGAAGRGKAPAAQRLRTVLLVNAVLDVGYVATGAYVCRRRPTAGGRVTPEQAAAHGAAVVVQGALLLVLDSVYARALGPHVRSVVSER